MRSDLLKAMKLRELSLLPGGVQSYAFFLKFFRAQTPRNRPRVTAIFKALGKPGSAVVLGSLPWLACAHTRRQSRSQHGVHTTLYLPLGHSYLSASVSLLVTQGYGLGFHFLHPLCPRFKEALHADFWSPSFCLWGLACLEV